MVTFNQNFDLPLQLETFWIRSHYSFISFREFISLSNRCDKHVPLV